MNFLEHQVIEFKRKNHLKKVTLKNLLKVCRQNGYIVKYYSASKLIFATLNLWKKAKNADSISIVDSNGNTLIFLRDTFSDEKKLYALAHELGHITLKHEDHSENYAENEADLFAHYLLSENSNIKLNIILTMITILLCICTILIIIFIPQPNIVQTKTTSTDIQSFTVSNNQEITNNSVCYYARYSEVYHLYKDCYYLKNSKKIYTDTIDKCHLDRLCSACEHRLKRE